MRNDPDALIEIIVGQQELVAELRAEIEALKKKNDDLDRRIQEAERKAHRPAATHLGPRALGVALELSQRHGLTKRRTCRVLRELFWLRLSPGGLVQAAHRMAGKLTEHGARTWEILASLSATLAQRQESLRDIVAKTAPMQPGPT